MAHVLRRYNPSWERAVEAGVEDAAHMALAVRKLTVKGSGAEL